MSPNKVEYHNKAGRHSERREVESNKCVLTETAPLQSIEYQQLAPHNEMHNQFDTVDT